MNAVLKRCKQAIRWRLHAMTRAHRDENAHFNSVLTQLLCKAAPSPVIFDVGAHQGESVKRYRTLFPAATIHTFEPDRDNYSILQKNWGNKNGVFTNNVGVSACKGTLTFHRNLKSNTSGFHAVNVDSDWAKNRSARHAVTPEKFTEKSYDVPTVDLDSYVAERGITHIDLLKIDTQGHEDEVLKGCRKCLENGMIDVIETELIVGNCYTKSLQFYDLEQILIPLGYRFYGIDQGGDLFHTPSLSFNLIYVRENFLK